MSEVWAATVLPKHSGVTRSMLPFPFYNFPYSVFRLPFPDSRLPFPVSRLPSLVFRLPPSGTQAPETDLQWSFRFHFHLWGRTGPTFSSSDLLGDTRGQLFRPFFRYPKRVSKMMLLSRVLDPKTEPKPSQI